MSFQCREFVEVGYLVGMYNKEISLKLVTLAEYVDNMAAKPFATGATPSE